MSGWKCFMVPEKPKRGSDEYRPGAMWFGKKQDNPDYYIFAPTKEFIASGRKPLFVLVPSTRRAPAGPPWLDTFCLDECDTNKIAEGIGWTWTGEPPNVTMSPSLHCPGSYHGFIQNGIVTKDCEGREYPDWPFTV